MPEESPQLESRRRLVKKVVCPHCWTSFPPEDALWISEAPALVGDVRLGETERVRFLPTEYDVDGFALDAKGYPCKDFACPHCHLRLPHCSLEAPSIFMSIVGAPASGKSYYLAASTQKLRKTLPKRFFVNFVDADPVMNRRLQEYESLQFLSGGDKIVKIEKTEEQGDLYNAVQFGEQTIVYPQPFVFQTLPAREHPNVDKAGRLSRTICLYDNAGESYLPTLDADSASLPVTRHLGRSECVFFLYDPTQNPRFNAACRRVSKDPQVTGDEETSRRRSSSRQEDVFMEMCKRLRTYRRMNSTDRYQDLLIVVVTKLDIWRSLLSYKDFEREPISKKLYEGREYCFLRTDIVANVSELTRELLMDLAPEFVSTAESFAKEIVYIPVSATGGSPVVDPVTKTSGFRAKDVEPKWCATPMLYAISRLTKGVVPVGDGKAR